ncbi:BglII/BstYI family type II restriction endonuclease [Acidithiobacillus caldus]|uniref:BglII/BstYI family type II restriction endonuclease n=1 Tax=Acidithiobacillus caldus TaxID=33059 RepID=UPI0021F87B12|nr:BglII/BstYI family type II restriction endonuclease [Acidithiobacillus caldus]
MTNDQDPEQDSEAEDQDAEAQEAENNGADDVSLRPGPNADDPADVEKYISPEVLELYDVYSYRHAAAILATSFPDEMAEIEHALLDFRITTHDIGTPGGNESDIPKKIFSHAPACWMV